MVYVELFNLMWNVNDKICGNLFNTNDEESELRADHRLCLICAILSDEWETCEIVTTHIVCQNKHMIQ